MYNFRTDMADERRDIYKKANNIENEVPGIEVNNWQDGDNIKISKVNVLDKEERMQLENHKENILL